MNQLEERLREDLLRATDFAVEVDADAIVAAGRRDRSRRVVRTASVGLAATAAVGLLTWGLGGRLSTGAPDVGATIAASPAPAPTVPTVPTVALNVVSFDVLPQFTMKSVTHTDEGEVTAQPAVEPGMPARVEVSPQGDGRYELTVITVAGERTVKVVDVEAGGVTTTALLPEVLVGVIGGDATWVDVRPFAVAGAGGWVETGALGESGEVGEATAFVMAFPEEGTSAADAAGVVWADARGRLHDSAGLSVVSTEVSVGKAKGVVYLEPEGPGLRYHDEVGGDLRVEVRQYPRVSFHAGLSTSEAADHWDASGLGVLPKGATDAEFIWREEAKEKSVSTVRLGDRDVFVVSARLPTSAEPARMDGGLTSIEYTTADGTRASYRPGE